MFSVDNRLDGQLSPLETRNIFHYLAMTCYIMTVTLLLLKKNNSFLKGKTSEWGRNSNTFTKINL